MGIYDSPPNMPQLRYLYKANAIRGFKFALATAIALTSIGTYYVYQKKIVSVRNFYQSYDPDLEWERLLNSGLLKTVDKKGKPVDMFD